MTTNDVTAINGRDDLSASEYTDSSNGTATMKTIDPDMKLDGFSLQQALESIYCSFSSVLLGCGATDSPDLFCKEIPGMVFDAAVGAGWVPLAEDLSAIPGTGGTDVVWQMDWAPSEETVSSQWVLDKTEAAEEKGSQLSATSPANFTQYQRARLVQLGEFLVERTYAESFLAILQDTIDFHMADR